MNKNGWIRSFLLIVMSVFLCLPTGVTAEELTTETEEETASITISSGSSPYNSSRDGEVKPLQGTDQQKIAALLNMFPQGRFWNHPATENKNYWPESTTGYPCSSHNTYDGAYQCNFFDGLALCDGFAFLCFYKFNGQRYSSAGCEEVNGNQGIKVGDVIETHTALDGPNGHLAFVWKISGNTIYKLEANYARNCQIWQSSTVQVSQVTKHWRRTTRTVSYDAAGGQGNMNSHSYLMGNNTQAQYVGYSRPGYIFMGWNVKDAATGQYLYWDIFEDGNTVQFAANENPEHFGFQQVLLQNCENLDRYKLQAGNIVLTASWEKISDEGNQMFRLYNPNSGEHFYTQNQNEYLNLTKVGWRMEGFGWLAPKTSDRPVYRIYNSNAGDHHYTVNQKERDALIKLGWKDEGTGWFSADESGEPLYRQYNPNAKTGTHNYTTSKKENDYLVSIGWQDEGIGWYGLK